MSRASQSLSGCRPASGYRTMTSGLIPIVRSDSAGIAIAKPLAVLAKVFSAGMLGIQAFTVVVEVAVGPGLPGYDLVGHAAHAVREGGVRIRAALANSGFKLPPRRVTVNLAPAGLRKDGALYDLPIAIAIMAALDLVPRNALEKLLIVGELALDGQLRAITGGLPIALHSRESRYELVVPLACASEAAVVSELKVHAAANLAEVAAFLRGEVALEAPKALALPEVHDRLDLADIRGMEPARRALEVAAAGGHNLLLIGPPGCGKSMLARRLPSILKPLSEREAIETTCIYSAAGKLEGNALLSERPFRSPHQDISVAGLIGGGTSPRPGELSLAHHGVLFLDELPEFKRSVLESLRQPLEERVVTIVRAQTAVTYPASVTLVAALNPCPCGYRGSSQRVCICSDDNVRRYIGRISGPLLDRIDLHIETPHVDYRSLQAERDGEQSVAVRQRVFAAQKIQTVRNGASNALLSPRKLRQVCTLDSAADRQLERCVRRFGLSARAVHRVLRVARTVADLAERPHLLPSDISEAVSLRALDRQTTT